MRILSSLLQLFTFIVTAQGGAPIAAAAAAGTEKQCEGADCFPSAQPSAESTQAALKKVEASIAARLKERRSGGSKWGKNSGLSWHELPEDEEEEDNDQERDVQRRSDRYYSIARDQQKYSRHWGITGDDPNHSEQEFHQRPEGEPTHTWMSKTKKYQRRAEILGEASAEIRRIQQKYLAKLNDLEENNDQKEGHEHDDHSRSVSKRKSWSREDQRKSMDEYQRLQAEKFAHEAKKRRQERYKKAKEFTLEDWGKEEESETSPTSRRSASRRRRKHNNFEDWGQVGGGNSGGGDEASAAASQKRKSWGRRLDQNKKRAKEQWKEREWSDTWREEVDPSPPSMASAYAAHIGQSTMAPPSASTLRRLFKAVKAAISLQPTQYYHASNDYAESQTTRKRRKTRLFAY